MRVFLLVIASSLPAHAQDNCAMAERLKRIVSTISFLRSQPVGAVISDNISILQSDIRMVQGINLEMDDAEASDTASRNAIMEFVAALRLLQENTAEQTPPAMITTFQSQAWRDLLPRVGSALRTLPCATLKGGPSAAGEGNSTEYTALDTSPKKGIGLGLEGILRTAAYTSGTILALVASGMMALPLLQRYLRQQRRRNHRYIVDLATSLVIADDQSDAKIVNLSCTGAKIRHYATDPPLPSSEISVLFDEAWHLAKVIWANNLYLGVQFKSHLPVKRVQTLANAGRFDGLGRWRS